MNLSTFCRFAKWSREGDGGLDAATGAYDAAVRAGRIAAALVHFDGVRLEQTPAPSGTGLCICKVGTLLRRW